MKVMLASLYHPELVRGGAQQICHELFEGLTQRTDVDVTLLAAIDEGVPGLHKAGAGITGFDQRPGEFLFLSRDYDYTWDRVQSPRLVERFVEFLEEQKPDVVHFHHFLLFGIDLLSLTRRILPNCLIVFTFHEFLSMCAAGGHMIRRTDGSLCERVSAVRCHQCFPKQSPEHFFLRRMWMQRHLDAVDIFTVPTRFMIPKFVDWGIDKDRIFHVSNGQLNRNKPAMTASKMPQRNRFGFFGQMVDAKGIHILISAVEILRQSGFRDFEVEINGDNVRFASAEHRVLIETFQATEAMRPPVERLVVFNGSYQVSQLASRMRRVDWCLVPSVWWETFGLVISEAWMFGRPVIASNVGGMAERITHEVDGLLFEMGDAHALAASMQRACTEAGLWERLAAGIVPPPSRDSMVQGFLDVYRSVPGSNAVL